LRDWDAACWTTCSQCRPSTHSTRVIRLARIALDLALFHGLTATLGFTWVSCTARGAGQPHDRAVVVMVLVLLAEFRARHGPQAATDDLLRGRGAKQRRLQNPRFRRHHPTKTATTKTATMMAVHKGPTWPWVCT
jgi:hypothetical protein